MRRRQSASFPKPWPRKRRRALSFARSEEDHVTLIGRAGYFGKLPFEIRQKIYTYVLGNRLFGIAHFSNRRAVHGFIYRYSWKNNPLFPRKVSNAGNPPSSSEFSLLKTCRFIYIESGRFSTPPTGSASIMLYSSHTPASPAPCFHNG
jgi:hypothetical protein